MMRPILLKQIETWHEAEEHQKIVDAIAALPEEERDYELTSLLARALNNLGDYKTAMQFLFSVAKEGQQDSLWFYRMGYAYFYLGKEEKALSYFQKALELNPQEEDAMLFIAWCEEALAEKQEGDFEQSYAEVYTKEEMDLLESYITKYFGGFPFVFHELVSPDIHVDIAVIEPTDEKPYYTLMTMGMGAHAMTVPEELLQTGIQRAELLLCLPANWNIESDQEEDYWPVHLLKTLARLPIQEDSWLGWGHSIAHGEPFASNTSFCGCFLLDPPDLIEDAEECILPNGEKIVFYEVIPLYQQEMDYKVSYGTDALLKKMSFVSHVIDIDRANAISN